MKKLGIIAMAFVLMLSMSQCKKENTTTSNDEGSKVPITLNVTGNGGSRVAVEGSTGVVTFETGDVLYVVSNGVYVGTMTYNGTVFSGEVTEPTEGQKLQFYFLGNKTPVFNSDNTGCSVAISDQTEYLPVISYAPSRENYQIGKTDYNATLLNKCALVKFDVSTVSDASTCIFGMNNMVTVNFTTNEFTYGQDDEGVITLPAGNGEKWVILLPQDEMSQTEAHSADGLYTGTCDSIPAIAENDYQVNGITLSISHPTGAINGLFTINANGDQVYFSKGNLQYQASTNTWRFASPQWNSAGYSANTQISSNYSGWIDLFGWGTSGYNHGAVAYQPWSTSKTWQNYYAYGSYSCHLYDQTGKADWGYNAISNGGNQENSGWRTLNDDEWIYVIYHGGGYVFGTVNNVKGLILLPDNWTTSIYTLNGGDFSSNIISSSDWINILEANGAVFLPAVGLVRYGTNISNYGNEGLYWSATHGSDYGRLLNFYYSYSSHIAIKQTFWRYDGLSVRLVRNAE